MNLRKYGLNVESYHEMSVKQNHVCAVCFLPETDSNQHKKMSLAVDHDHNSGKIRGLLCHRCNRALGLLGDSAERVESLLKYRRQHDE